MPCDKREYAAAESGCAFKDAVKNTMEAFRCESSSVISCGRSGVIGKSRHCFSNMGLVPRILTPSLLLFQDVVFYVLYCFQDKEVTVTWQKLAGQGCSPTQESY